MADDLLSLLRKSGDVEDEQPAPDDFDKEEVVLGVEDDKLTSHMRAMREHKVDFVPSAPPPSAIVKELSAFAVEYDGLLRLLTDLDAELRALQRSAAKSAPEAPVAKIAALVKLSTDAQKAASRHSARFNSLRRDVLTALQPPAPADPGI